MHFFTPKMPHLLLLPLFKSRPNVPDARKAYFDTDILLLPNSVTAKTLLTTFAAMYPVPYSIELVGNSSTSQGRRSGSPLRNYGSSSLSGLARLGSDARTDISYLAIEDRDLEMNVHA